MNEEILQEYADNRGVTLVVDRERGIIPSVKLLGTLSKKGREYPKQVMAKALPMYEGMRVNIDHVDPGQRRSLRDRIGLVKNVMLKEDGLYGDFHFNPKHALADQIAWDAENAPQNLGFSHDTRGLSRNQGGKVVVESIDKVLSVDLVANPATTAGLFEDAVESSELKLLQEELSVLKAEKAARDLQESIAAELKAAGLDPDNRQQVSAVFLEDLRATPDSARRRAKIDDRKLLVSARRSSATPVTAAPLQESHDAAVIPPSTVPLARRIARFVK